MFENYGSWDKKKQLLNLPRSLGAALEQHNSYSNNWLVPSSVAPALEKRKNRSRKEGRKERKMGRERKRSAGGDSSVLTKPVITQLASHLAHRIECVLLPYISGTPSSLCWQLGWMPSQRRKSEQENFERKRFSLFSVLKGKGMPYVRKDRVKHD